MLPIPKSSRRTPVGTSFMGLRLRNDVRRKLEELADREQVTVTQIFRWAIRDYLEKRFDAKDGHG